jgi:hypothetical protein
MGPVKGPVDVKTGAGRRAVPMAFVVRRALMATSSAPNETARTSSSAAPRPRRSSPPRSVPAPTRIGPSRARADHPHEAVAHHPKNAETPVNTEVLKYRYRDSKRTQENRQTHTFPANRTIRFSREPPSRGP